MSESNKYVNKLRSLVAYIRENLSDLVVHEAEYDRALEQFENPKVAALVAHIKANITELAAKENLRSKRLADGYEFLPK